MILKFSPEASGGMTRLRPPGIGKVFYVNMGGDNENTGLSPNSALATITYALTLCVGDRNDYIVVLDDWQEPATVTVNVNRVHIIGVGTSPNHPLVMLNASADFSIFTIGSTGANVEIAGFDMGGGATGAGIDNPSGTPMGLYIHDCIFGHSFAGDTPQDGIRVSVNVTNIRIEDCIFLGNEAEGGGTLTRDGIHWQGGGDPLGGVIRNNRFTGIPGVGINMFTTAANSGGLFIEDNRFMAEIADTPAIGWGITLQGPGSFKGCLVSGNVASLTGDATGNNPYRDLSTGAIGTCLNGWVNNHHGNALSVGPAVA